LESHFLSEQQAALCDNTLFVVINIVEFSAIFRRWCAANGKPNSAGSGKKFDARPHHSVCQKCGPPVYVGDDGDDSG
jgi:hypothetical protein